MLSNILLRIKAKIKYFWLITIRRIIRKFHCPKIPVNPDGKVLIHIGCGELNDPRYINIDTRPMPHIHFMNSIEDLPGIFTAEYADLIYACHVLEHISHRNLIKTIQKLYKCLKRGGILRISVPDFDTIVDMYRESNSIDSIKMPLMGGQDYKSNFHFSVFNKRYLTEILLKTGFKEVREWNPVIASNHNFDDWSRRNITWSNKEWKISLNLEGIK